MRVATLATEDDFDGWRTAARALAAARVPADQVVWQVGAQADDLFGDEAVPEDPDAPPPPEAARGEDAALRLVEQELGGRVVGTVGGDAAP